MRIIFVVYVGFNVSALYLRDMKKNLREIPSFHSLIRSCIFFRKGANVLSDPMNLHCKVDEELHVEIQLQEQNFATPRFFEMYAT